MAVTETRDVVIEATPDEIMAVLFDLESLTQWSSTHQKVDILDRDEAGHPSRSRQVVKIVGISDEQVLDYRVHDDGVSWTLVSSKQQRAQNARYTLTPEGDGTRVRFELTVDPLVPLPGFLIKKGAGIQTLLSPLTQSCTRSLWPSRREDGALSLKWCSAPVRWGHQRY
jgi:Polyketide cyclase / dehydrase and lipid transport